MSVSACKVLQRWNNVQTSTWLPWICITRYLNTDLMPKPSHNYFNKGPDHLATGLGHPGRFFDEFPWLKISAVHLMWNIKISKNVLNYTRGKMIWSFREKKIVDSGFVKNMWWNRYKAADGMWLKLKFHRPIVLFPMKKSWENWESILELTMSMLLYWLCQVRKYFLTYIIFFITYQQRILNSESANLFHIY